MMKGATRVYFPAPAKRVLSMELKGGKEDKGMTGVGRLNMCVLWGQRCSDRIAGCIDHALGADRLQRDGRMPYVRCSDRMQREDPAIGLESSAPKAFSFSFTLMIHCRHEQFHNYFGGRGRWGRSTALSRITSTGAVGRVSTT